MTPSSKHARVKRASVVSRKALLQRVHPDDLALVRRVIDRATEDQQFPASSEDAGRLGVGNEADLYVNSNYFGTVFASAEPADVAARLAATQRPFAARCLTDGAPEAVGWKTIPS
jgi:hypothetical protein